MKMRPRNLLLGLGLLVAAAALALAFRGRGEGARFATAAADRGDIADVVGATGVLQAVTTVQVGSQVSGTIKDLLADFNSNVRKNQVIARLDPSLFDARVAQSRANLASAQAEVERARATIADARQKYERAKTLAEQDLLPESDLESAKATHDGARAQLQASEATVSQATAALNQALVDLAHTVIAAPIDGVVLARNVDAGQTVAASFQAPVLFVIANDLTRMLVNASIDEADIGRVRAGQDVTFRVDAYPDETFRGRLEQVRLQPVTAQNVVTYNTIVAVDNKSLRLMPGMTATVSVVIHESKGALRVPASALRFRPEGFGDKRGPGAASSAAGPGKPGLVFVPGEDGRPRPTRIRVGVSDGRFVEALEGLDEGRKVITGVEDSGRPRAPGASPSPGANNPFSPPRPNPRARQ